MHDIPDNVTVHGKPAEFSKEKVNLLILNLFSHNIYFISGARFFHCRQPARSIIIHPLIFSAIFLLPEVVN